MDRHVDMGTEWYRAKILRTPKIQKTILPSGNLTVCYWTYPFIIDLPIQNGDFL